LILLVKMRVLTFLLDRFRASKKPSNVAQKVAQENFA
jgi:hypothetical protein